MKIAAAFLMLTMAGSFGCAGGSGTLASQPVPQPMPPNAEWQGIYQGPYHIVLRIVTKGNHATGTWSAVGGRDGELTGTVSGNLLVFDWSERGTNADAWSGHGYLVYSAGASGKPAEVSGEASMGSNASNSWWAIKRPGVPTAAAAASLVEGGDDDRGGKGKCTVDCDPMDNETDFDVELDTDR